MSWDVFRSGIGIRDGKGPDGDRPALSLALALTFCYLDRVDVPVSRAGVLGDVREDVPDYMILCDVDHKIKIIRALYGAWTAV